MKEHDSLRINPEQNLWCWFSQNKGGDIIKFLTDYEGKDFLDTVEELLGESPIVERSSKKYEPIKEEKRDIILPLKNENNKKVMQYLANFRKIDFEIVAKLINKGLIYQNDKGGVVFLSKDKEDKVMYACVRGTNEKSKFRQDLKNSDKSYGFNIKGKSNKLFVFESPIDLLSHATMTKIQGKDWELDNRLSLGGVSDKALERYLKDNKNIKEIVLFLDNDETGLKSAKEIAKKYANNYEVKLFTSKEKDLNETLVKYKEIKANKEVNLKNFIEKIKADFISPKLTNENIIKEIEEIAEDYLDFTSILDENIKIGKTVGGEFVFLMENGGFKFDFENLNFNCTLLEGSEKNYFSLNKDLETINDKKELFIVDNFLNYIFFRKEIEEAHTVLTSDLSLENIRKIKEELGYNDKICIVCDDENIKNKLNEKMIGESKIIVDIFDKEMLACHLKKEKKASIKDKIDEKKKVVDSIKR